MFRKAASFRNTSLFILLFSFAGLFPSCEVFVDLGLKNATYELYEARIGSSGTNFLAFILPDYHENDPSYRYEIHFFGGDKCVGTYYAADTVNYEVEGVWSLVKSDVLRIDLDDTVDGDFDISKLDKNTFFMSTEHNTHGIPIDPPTLPLDMYIRRTY